MHRIVLLEALISSKVNQCALKWSPRALAPQRTIPLNWTHSSATLPFSSVWSLPHQSFWLSPEATLNEKPFIQSWSSPSPLPHWQFIYIWWLFTSILSIKNSLEEGKDIWKKPPNTWNPFVRHPHVIFWFFSLLWTDMGVWPKYCQTLANNSGKTVGRGMAFLYVT